MEYEITWVVTEKHGIYHQRKKMRVSKVGRGLDRALYATYLSFIPSDEFSYKINHS